MKKNIILYVFLFVCNLIKAQVINSGTLIVSENDVMTCGAYNLNNAPTAVIVNDGDIYLNKDLNNDGSINYQGLNGIFHFKGNVNQNISTGTTGVTNFQNINFDNQNNSFINVINSFNINRYAYFNSGIVNNNAAQSEIYFNQPGEALNMSNSSYINGKVLKEGNNFFTFPVGSKITTAFRPFYFKANISSDLVQSEYLHSNSDPIYPHINKEDDIVYINEKEYWEITNTNESNPMEAGILVDNNFLSTNISMHLYGTVKRIVAYDATADKWVNKGGVIDPLTNIIYNNNIDLKSGPYTLALCKSKEQEDLDLFIYNAISPNENGQNDYMIITGVENYPNNSLTILNRYGQELFSTKSYGVNGNLWYGTYKDKKLPTGTYFYIFKFVIENGEEIEKTGYLYIN